VEYEYSARFDAVPAQIAAARAWLVGSLRAMLPPGAADPVTSDAVLAISELATNSLRAGSTHFTIGFTLEADSVRIAVHDSAPGLPLQRRAGRTEVNGRGLEIVDALASDWGTATDADGKEVWAVIPIRLTD